MTSNCQNNCVVLFIDDDRDLGVSVGRYLSARGYKVALATDGQQGLELFSALKPQVAICDLRIPVTGGVGFLEEAQKIKRDVPVIMTTGFPEIQSAITVMRQGAFDYLVKPFDLQTLHLKIEQALKNVVRLRENAVLAEMSSLNEISAKLTNTHDLSHLLKITLGYCLELTRTEIGAILLLDPVNQALSVSCQRGLSSVPAVSSLSDPRHWRIEKQVVAANRGILVGQGKINPSSEDPALIPVDQSSVICIPLRSATSLIGVVTIARPGTQQALSSIEMNMLEVLASQAGIAINNAHLYQSVNQKLQELSLVSTYSEQLMGLMDKDDIITCLFDTIRKHFNVDLLAFLVLQKRQHQLLYWSRGEFSKENREILRREIVGWYNQNARANLLEKQASFRLLKIETIKELPVCFPLSFNTQMMVTIDGANYGCVYFGAMHGLNNSEEKLVLLSSLVSQTRIALTNAKLYEEMKENYIKTIKALAIAVDAKDNYTHNHSENVMNISEEIAREMGLDNHWIGIIRDAGLLHDIGKIGVPGTILNRPGPLTYDEFNGVMKTHAIMGANIVKEVPFLEELYTLILHHHENWDGSGYPDALHEEDIPLGARILRVADAFEAMTSNRPYRDSLGNDEAIRRLVESKGVQFDPAVVDAMLLVGHRKGWAGALL